MSKSNKARIEAMEQQLQELRVELKGEQKDLQSSVERSLSEFGRRLEEIRRRMDESARNPNGGGGKEPIHQGSTPANAHHSPIGRSDPLNRGPRLEFPMFAGDKPRTWIMKCEDYFIVNPMTDLEKVIMASVYMEDRADVWYMNYIEGREQIGWARFAEMVLERFCDPQEQNLVGAFNKLEQESSVEVYREKFEELKYFMVQINGTFTEEYFVQSFLSGLKQEIRTMAEMLNPTTLAKAIQLAKLQESSLEFTTEHYKNNMRGSVIAVQKGNGWGLQENINFTKSGVHTEERAPFVRKLTPEELDIRRNKERNSTPNTIKLLGKVKNDSLSILVVTGSTHSFLDPQAAKRIGCEIEYTNPLLVTVADGRRMDCNSRCSGFKWEMGNHIFTADVRILKLGGCDMVIGVDLLRRLGPVIFDFDQQSITILQEGKEIKLQGETG